MSEHLRTIEQLYRHRPHLRSAPLAIVALGANLPGAAGSPAQTLVAVLPALQALSDAPLLVSDIIETDPVDCPPGSPRFANAVAVLAPLPDTDPVGLLQSLQQLEIRFGRRRKGVVNEARELDLDLISFGAVSMDTGFLQLPHPRARERYFVLQPLASIWPDYRFPADARTVSERLLTL